VTPCLHPSYFCVWVPLSLPLSLCGCSGCCPRSNLNFPYPITLTTCHMLFSSTLCFLVFHVFKVSHTKQYSEAY